MVKVSGVCKKYGSEFAVHNISFCVDKGEAVGIYGSRGAGKTTLADIITGCAYADSGSVSVCGHDIKKDAKNAKRKIGYMPEAPSLYYDMTAQEYLHFVCALKHVPKNKIKQASDEAVEKAKAKGSSGLIGGMSVVEKRRLSLAAALCGEMEALVIDDPTVSLDPEEAAEMRSLISPLCGDYAVILLSRTVRDISEICGSVILLSKGKISGLQEVGSLLKAAEDKQRVFVRLASDKKSGLGLLKGIKAADCIECIGCCESGTYDFIAESSDPGLRAKIFDACTKSGITLMGMSLISVTVEDVFAQLMETGGDGKK